MGKLLSQRILLYFALSCFAGCSSISISQNTASYDSQSNQGDDAESSDGPPYAIGQYLNQIKVARSNPSEKQETRQE